MQYVNNMTAGSSAIFPQGLSPLLTEQLPVPQSPNVNPLLVPLSGSSFGTGAAIGLVAARTGDSLSYSMIATCSPVCCIQSSHTCCAATQVAGLSLQFICRSANAQPWSAHVASDLHMFTSRSCYSTCSLT